jgi:hypothetical protein
MLPEDPKDETEREALEWLYAHQNDRLLEWFKNLGANAFQHPRVVVDDMSNWDYAIALLRRAQWPTQTSPNTAEVLLMNFAWWTACVERRGKHLAQYYVGMLSRITTPSYAGDTEFSAKERVRAVRSLGNAVWLLDATFDMDPYVRGWAKAWARSGFCKVEISPKTVAALINSDAPSDVQAPWEAFSLIVPPDLCDPVRRLWCSRHPETGVVQLVSGVEDSGRAYATNPTSTTPAPWATAERHVMLENLVRGACIAIENGAVQHREGVSKASIVRGERLPVPERWCISADITIDLRQHVVDEWQGRRKSTHYKSQWCVRGHYRNQACGPQMSQRKRIWVHPYWKGDPGAIALLRKVSVE